MKETNTCSKCQFYEISLQHLTQGECHLNPPQVIIMPSAMGQIQIVSAWPSVQSKHWCKGFELKIDRGQEQ